MKLKQRFGKKEITQTKVVNNLLRYYKLASPEEVEAGKKWYTEANKFCQQLSEQYGLELYKVAGIVASFSPQAEWGQNKSWAEEFIRNRGRGFVFNRDRTIKAKNIYKCGHPEQAYDLLSSKPNGALKTRSFFKNIVLPGFCDTVCLDRHALAAAFQRPHKTYPLGDREAHLTPKQYHFLSKCYVYAAKRVGMIPCDFQALTWEKYRAMRGLSKPPVVEGGFVPADIENF